MGSLGAALKGKLRAGVKIPGIPARVRVEPSSQNTPDDAVVLQVFRRHLARVVELIPSLGRYYTADSAYTIAECLAVLELFDELIPNFHAQAFEPRLRTRLARLKAAVGNVHYRSRLEREIAKSDFRSGAVERALALRTADGESPTPADLERELSDAQREYGSATPLMAGIDVWQRMQGDVRGRSLKAYFQTIEPELHGKAILHVSPEVELERWLRPLASATGGHYRTLDPFRNDVDFRQDLTALELESDQFDWIICHRVLEHILDDHAAMREMFRVLRSGGRLNISVPQSMQMEKTNEWIVRDGSHHDHVRQYGRDFTSRLESVGFTVTVVPFLLDLTLEQHLAGQTYPMRCYTCTK